MNLSVLQLKGYHPSSIQVKTWQDPAPSGCESFAACKISFGIDQDNVRNWQLDIAVKFSSGGENNETGYTGEIEFRGQFSVSPEYNDDLGQLVIINGGSMLYSAIREHLLSLTGRGLHGSFYLPSISMVGEYNDLLPKIEEIMNKINSSQKTQR